MNTSPNWIILSSVSFVQLGSAVCTRISNSIYNEPINPLSFFSENMILYARSIRERDEFLTNTEDGKMTFAAVEDVADAAFEALTTEKIAREELFIIGPELLTHDEVSSVAVRLFSLDEHVLMFDFFKGG